MPSLGERLISEVFSTLFFFSVKHIPWTTKVQDRTRSPRSDPFQSPENPIPSIPNHRSSQLRSARGNSRAAPCSGVPGRWGTGMSVPGLGMLRAPASLSRRPFPACPLQPEPPEHPSLRHTDFLRKKSEDLQLSVFRTHLGQSCQGRPVSAEYRPCRGGFCRAAPAPLGLQVRVPPVPHPSPRQGSQPPSPYVPSRQMLVPEPLSVPCPAPTRRPPGPRG